MAEQGPSIRPCDRVLRSRKGPRDREPGVERSETPGSQRSDLPPREGRRTRRLVHIEKLNPRRRRGMRPDPGLTFPHQPRPKYVWIER